MKLKTFNCIIEVIFPVRHKANETFDFPDYCGLPKAVINGLSSEAVDAMQDVLQTPHKTKKAFAKAYFERCKELGEPVE